MKQTYEDFLKNIINVKTGVDNMELFRKLQGLNDINFEKFVTPNDEIFKTESYVSLKADFDECIRLAQLSITSTDEYSPIKYLFKKRIKEKHINYLEKKLWENVKTSLNIVLKNSLSLANRYYQSQNNQSKLYDEWMLSEGYSILIEEYPVLLILISDLLNEYIDLLDECINRIIINGKELNQAFGINVDEKITDIVCNISDRHYKGKSVVILSFNRKKLVYKPRSMDVDVFWYEMAKWLTESNNKIKIGAAKAISYGEYGFSEWIEHDNTLKDSGEDYSYFCGNLLGIVSLLGGTDFHYENLVCADGIPVIIDVETLVLPGTKELYSANEEFLAIDVFLQTPFMRTCLLPKWIGNCPENAIDIGGFSGKFAGGTNIPLNKDGVFVEFGNNADQFINGFEDVLRYVLNNKNEYIRLLESIKNIKLRYILRNTRIYYSLLNYFSNPKYLKNFQIFNCAICRVFVPYLLMGEDDTTEKMWEIATAEYNELQKFHIPIFGIYGDSTNLFGPNGSVVLKDYFHTTPYQYTCNTVDILSEQLIEKYKGYLYDVISIHKIQKNSSYNWQTSYFDVKRKWLINGREVLSEEYLNNLLHYIYGAVCSSVLNEDAQLFFAPVKDKNTGRYSMEIMRDSIYSGRYGVQIFLEMYYHFYHISDKKNALEDRVYRMALKFYKNKNETKWFDLSITNGVAGLLLLLRNFAVISRKREFVVMLFDIIKNISKESIIRHEETDYYNGISGLLYVICNCYKQFETECDDKGRDIIQCIVEQLLKKRSDKGLWFQEEYYYKPLTGLGHGQSGYILSLSESISFIELDLKEQVICQINKCISYEKESFDVIECNSPDYRKLLLKKDGNNPKKKKFMHGYCSGVLGSSLAINYSIDSEIYESEKKTWREYAVRYLNKEVLIGNDSLCCGTASWIDYLAEFHKGEEWAEQLFKKITYSITEQGYALNGLKSIDDISLFKGMSGVGYAVLRYIGDYPSVLL